MSESDNVLYLVFSWHLTAWQLTNVTDFTVEYDQAAETGYIERCVSWYTLMPPGPGTKYNPLADK